MEANNYSNKKKDTPEKRKIEPSIDRVPDVRKPSRTKTFFSSFIASDLESVLDYAINKIIVPKAKTLIVDVIRNTAEMMIMGPDSVSRRNYTNYSRESVTRYHSSDPRPPQSYPVTSYAPFSEPLLETWEEANDIIRDMIDYVEEFPYISISDFLGFCNRPKDDEYTYVNYGWSADVIRRCVPEQIPDGRYIIKLPRPRYIR